MQITILPVNNDRFAIQVAELDRMIADIHRSKSSCRGRLLAVLQTRVAVLAHLEVVHGAVSGTWEQRLTEAAARPEPTEQVGESSPQPVLDTTILTVKFTGPTETRGTRCVLKYDDKTRRAERAFGMSRDEQARAEAARFAESLKQRIVCVAYETSRRGLVWRFMLAPIAQ